jgi:preprotein translocase subunit Sec63
MAQYNFDEGGNMAAYFALSLLLLVLVPATLSLKPMKNTRE